MLILEKITSYQCHTKLGRNNLFQERDFCSLFDKKWPWEFPNISSFYMTNSIRSDGNSFYMESVSSCIDEIPYICFPLSSRFKNLITTAINCRFQNTWPHHVSRKANLKQNFQLLIAREAARLLSHPVSMAFRSNSDFLG